MLTSSPSCLKLLAPVAPRLGYSFVPGTGTGSPDRQNLSTDGAMEARLSAQFTAVVEALENQVTSKAVQAGPESFFGDATEAKLFVTNETVHGAFESWIGPITLMASGETDVSMRRVGVVSSSV